MSSGSNDSYGKFSMLLFVFSFILTIVFFIYIIIINPGPIDTGVFEVPVQFSKAQADERTTEWKALTPENIAAGEQFYKINCNMCHGQTGTDIVLERAVSGTLKYGQTPLEVYRSISKGFEGQHRLDYIPEHDKWLLVDYIRSKMTHPPEDSNRQWSQFLEEGMY